VARSIQRRKFCQDLGRDFFQGIDLDEAHNRREEAVGHLSLVPAVDGLGEKGLSVSRIP
jgi:hypothetical protein